MTPDIRNSYSKTHWKNPKSTPKPLIVHLQNSEGQARISCWPCGNGSFLELLTLFSWMIPTWYWVLAQIVVCNYFAWLSGLLPEAFAPAFLITL